MHGARDLQTNCAGQTKRIARPERQRQGREKDIQRGRQRDRAEKAVKESEQPKETESAQRAKFRGRKTEESRGQKRAEAETEASARGDAGTRRERFGSVTVLPHLEDITSFLKKKYTKKGLDIKRRQILLSLEGVGRRWPG